MIIDAHVHVGEWDHPGFLGRKCTVSEAVAELERCGIGGAALVPTDQCDNAGLLSGAQEVIANGYDGSLWLFPWVRLLAEGTPGAEDLGWIQENLSVVTGIKIHPSLSRARITDAGFQAALEVANQNQLVVLVHCGRWQEIASFRFAMEAAGRYPDAKFLLAHAGGDTPENATNAALLLAKTGLENVWFEFSGLREYWVIERNVRLLGAERYLMGSDYALAHPRMYLGAVAAMDLPESDKQKILGENAKGLFGAPLAPQGDEVI